MPAEKDTPAAVLSKEAQAIADQYILDGDFFDVSDADEVRTAIRERVKKAAETYAAEAALDLIAFTIKYTLGVKLNEAERRAHAEKILSAFQNRAIADGERA